MKQTSQKIRMAPNILSLAASPFLGLAKTLSLPAFHVPKTGKNYIPAGPHKNVTGCFVKNSLVAADIRKRHHAWHLKKFGTAPIS